MLVRSRPLEVLQKGLEWLYILICFALIWYAIAVVSSLWRWVSTRQGGMEAAWSSAKLALTVLLAKGTVWLGVVTST